MSPVVHPSIDIPRGRFPRISFGTCPALSQMYCNEPQLARLASLPPSLIAQLPTADDDKPGFCNPGTSLTSFKIGKEARDGAL
jgi:hypothetical protein